MTASFCLYLASVRKPSTVYRTFSVAIFSLALLAKESAVVLPGMLLLVELVYAKPGTMQGMKRLVIRLAPFAVLAAIYLIVRMSFFSLPQSGPYRISLGLFVLHNLGRYFLVMMDNFLAGFLDVPDIDLLHMHGSLQATNWWLAWAKFLVVAIAAVCLAQWRKWRLKREVLFSAGWFIIGLLPVLFLPHHFYLYYLLPATPGIMLVIGSLLAHSARELRARNPLSAVGLCVVVYAAILGYATLTIRRE
jgi:hypothetical protein